MSRTALFKAASEWEAATVARLVFADPTLVQARDKRGRTAQHVCANRRWDGRVDTAEASIATMRALLAAGGDIDVVQEIADDGEIFRATPLWYSVAWGRNLPLIKDLLRRGANPDWCLFAVVWANDAPLARMLLKAGSKTELKFSGETPLHYAARLGREPVINELVAAGADIRAGDSKGKTPLEYVRKKRLGERTRLLLGENIERSKPVVAKRRLRNPSALQTKSK